MSLDPAIPDAELEAMIQQRRIEMAALDELLRARRLIIDLTDQLDVLAVDLDPMRLRVELKKIAADMRFWNAPIAFGPTHWIARPQEPSS